MWWDRGADWEIRPINTSILLQLVNNPIKEDHRKLFWTANINDENRNWHFERVDGSLTRAGKSLFWYGI
jgi:N-acetyl-gamma-glutamyl-phosphate reductase/acetylglutamate kinase